jgi:hypothetical protein
MRLHVHLPYAMRTSLVVFLAVCHYVLVFVDWRPHSSMQIDVRARVPWAEFEGFVSTCNSIAQREIREPHRRAASHWSGQQKSQTPPRGCDEATFGSPAFRLVSTAFYPIAR